MSRKAQIKMGETIAILVIFFFLLVFGLSFYMNFFLRNVEKTAHEFSELEAIEVVQKTVYLPELQCTDMDVQIDSCFDLYKIQVLKEILENEDPGNKVIWSEYVSILGRSSLSIKPVYPSGPAVVVFDNTLADYTYKPVIYVPISLYNATSDTYSLGILNITYTRNDE